MDLFKSFWYKTILPNFYFIIVCILTIFYSTIFVFLLIYIKVITPSDKLKVKRRTVQPNCLNDQIFGIHKYVQLKDIKLHYVEGGNMDKPLIVFLHGFPDFWYSWRHQIKEFSKDFRTVAVDLRGYGHSDKPHGHQYYKTSLITEDIKDFIDSFDCKKCILIGHDWGGVIAWKFAKKYPDKLDKYVIINAPEESVFWKYFTSKFEQFLRSWYIFFFQSPYLPEMILSLNDLKIFAKIYRSNDGVLFLSEEDLEAYKFTFSEEGAFTPPLNYYRHVMSRNQLMEISNINTSELIKVPGLMVVSEDDKALSMDLLKKSAIKGGGDNIIIKIIEKGSHFVHQEKPQEVNEAISQFLRPKTNKE